MSESKFWNYIDIARGRAEFSYMDTEQPDQRKKLFDQAKEVSRLVKGLDGKGCWKGDYGAAVAGCVNTWKAMSDHRNRYQRADLILSSYYRQGKLLDSLEEMVYFAQADIKPTDTAEKLAVKGYNNFLFGIRSIWENAKEAYGSFPQTQKEDQAPIRNFLMTECRDNPFYDNWFQLYERLLVLQKKEGPLTRRECAGCFEELELTEYSMKQQRSALIQYLLEKKKTLLARAQRLATEAQKGEALYAALDALLTPELFERMDPDTPEMEQCSMEEIKQMYRELAATIKTTILDIYPR